LSNFQPVWRSPAFLLPLPPDIMPAFLKGS
jgi:hypothetical protein